MRRSNWESRVRSATFRHNSAIGSAPGPSAGSAPSPRHGRTGSTIPEKCFEFIARVRHVVVGGNRKRRGSQTMRKNSVFFLGAVAGTCLTLVVTASSGDLVIAAAKAAVSADTYSKLSLFGDVFERVRADYVEKPDDGRLVEAAISG